LSFKTDFFIAKIDKRINLLILAKSLTPTNSNTITCLKQSLNCYFFTKFIVLLIKKEALTPTKFFIRVRTRTYKHFKPIIMNSHIVKVLQAVYITHDVKCFRVEKPAGYDFIPGQATEISINLPLWNNQLRPFTFTCLREQDYLEFMIKIYRDHEGVTNMLGRTNAGAELILHDVFGAIQYKGPGVFIAGGAGITPFISIFRDLHHKNQLQGNKLIYSNKTSEDVIMEQELKEMLKDNFVKLFTRENVLGYIGKRIDRKYLIDNISDFGQYFYVCGKNEFVKSINGYLHDLGAKTDSILIEK
jgi:ferredoxin-NADP reductase